MDEILNLPIEGMADFSFSCSCGKRHSVDIKKIVLGQNILNNITEMIPGSTKIFMIADENTYNVCGEKLFHLLRQGCGVINKIIYQGKPPLIPDEKTLGRALVEIDKDTSLILAVGSGCINDLAKFLSYKFNIPFCIVPTAPSMDGYASGVSALIMNGVKTTYQAVCPYAIIADYEVIKNAPMEMIHAGFGDIVGKFTALTDWELSRTLNGEYFCSTSAGLVKNALTKCCKNAESLKVKADSSLASIFDSLVLSGMAMGLTGNSRPASGSEHHLAHYWEMDAIKNHKDHPLHGNMVGVAAIIIAEIYNMIDEIEPLPVETPDASEIKRNLSNAGCPLNPVSLNIDENVFKESILHAIDLRPERFTILHIARRMGLEAKISKRLSEIFY